MTDLIIKRIKRENMYKVMRVGWYVLNYYGFTQVNAISTGLPAHFKNQLNTMPRLMFSVV